MAIHSCILAWEIPRTEEPGGLQSIVVAVHSLSCPILCDPMDCSPLGSSIQGISQERILEWVVLSFSRGLQDSQTSPSPAQTHDHQVGDAIQPSHPLSSLSPPAFNLSQHQGLFQWVSSSHQVTNILELQLQHQFFQWMFRTDFLQDWLVSSPCSPRDSQESSPTPQFKSINSSTLSLKAWVKSKLLLMWHTEQFPNEKSFRKSFQMHVYKTCLSNCEGTKS